MRPALHLALHHGGDGVGVTVGFLGAGSLHHDADDGLGTARAQQHANRRRVLVGFNLHLASVALRQGRYRGQPDAVAFPLGRACAARQHAFRRRGGQRAGSGYNGGAQQQRQPQPDDPFASFWGAYGGNPYGNAGYGGYGSAGYGQAQQYDSIEMRAAKNYIDTGHYAEALNALGSVPAGKRNARWYFLSALAQSGLHNNAQAMEYARQAASMEPGNMQYQQLLSQLQGGGSWYSQQGQEYGRRTGGMNSVCTTFMLLNLCCACCGGGRMMYYPMFCCI